jgi:dUTP pyrophosphatase
MPTVKIQKISKNALIPQYMTTGAAGCDVTACLEAPMKIEAGKRAAIPTGLKFEIPQGYEIQVRPRSGLAFKSGLTVVNAPGTIDSDYRGEVKILVINLGEAPVEIQNGDRVAQLILQRVEIIQWQETESLEASTRDAGGFGSTGIRHCEQSEAIP